MEALSRTEYPGMLTSLQPAQAVTVLTERVKRIAKVNNEVADWLQERRRVEELYVQGLKKLVTTFPPNNQSELGIFTTPWQKIVSATESIAQSHHTFATRIEKDVEQPMRSFATKNREMAAMTTIQGNLASMAKDLDEAQKLSDKLAKKGGKANSIKVDNAAQKFETAQQQWDSQTPFVFEKLQAVDETRLNQLRDALTQYQTHEADQVERDRVTAENTLNSLLEVDTMVEIVNFAQNTTQGKVKIDRPVARRSGSNAGSLAPPATATSEDNTSQFSGRNETPTPEPKGGLKRFGTMLGRRRQSIQGSSFGRAPSPSKGFASLGRNSASRDGRPSPSPRASSNNLRETPSTDNRLSSLAESPTSTKTSRDRGVTAGSISENVNGLDPDEILVAEAVPDTLASGTTNGTPKVVPNFSNVRTPQGPPHSYSQSSSSQRDSEGFSVPATRNDPISQAQLEAADDSEQPQFKLDIRNDPIREEDADAEAALSSVKNTLRSSSFATPSRKAGTVRGRRDVRNTMYIPSPEVSFNRGTENQVLPQSPGFQTGAGRVAALAGDSTSDTQSIRSSRSLTGSSAVKHSEIAKPGLNSSIIETVSAYFENGELKSGTVIGEVALVHGHIESNPFASSGTDIIRLDNFPALEAIAPNHAFVDDVSSEKPGQYKVNLSYLAKSSVAFRYKVHIDNASLSTHVPLTLKPAWKPQGDKLGVVIEYALNPAFAAAPVTLQNVILIATYEGGKAAGCQTKPTGTHLKEKSLIYWRLGEITVDGAMQKVIARLVGAEGAELKPGMIEARWEYQGTSTGSGLGLSRFDASEGKGKEKEEVTDPFADESLGSPLTAASAAPAGKWVEVESVRKIVSGKYDAKQVLE